MNVVSATSSGSDGYQQLPKQCGTLGSEAPLRGSQGLLGGRSMLHSIASVAAGAPSSHATGNVLQPQPEPRSGVHLVNDRQRNSELASLVEGMVSQQLKHHQERMQQQQQQQQQQQHQKQQHPSTSDPPASTTVPALLDSLLQRGASGFLSLDCSFLFNILVTLLQAVGRHDAQVMHLAQGVDMLSNSVGDEFDEVHKKTSRPATADLGLQEVLSSIGNRLDDLERRCADALAGAAAAERNKAKVASLEEAVHSMRDTMVRTPPRREPSPVQSLSPPLKNSIQDMLVTCQTLAAKQAETVSVVSQACQRIDSLENAIGQAEHVLFDLCSGGRLTSAQQQLHDLLDLPHDLTPHLDTVDKRVQLLQSRPAFQSLLSKLKPSETDRCGIDSPRVSPYRQRLSPTSGSLNGLRQMLTNPTTPSPVPTPAGVTRGEVERADRLVAVLSQSLTDGKGMVQAAGVSPGRLGSPRAREFRASPHRSVSVSTAAGRDTADVTLLGIEVSDDVVIRATAADSAAAVGGLRAGDRILTFNGTSVATRVDFLRALARTRPSQLIPIVFLPSGSTSPVPTHVVVGGLGPIAPDGRHGGSFLPPDTPPAASMR